jgi:hypothetical protein
MTASAEFSVICPDFAQFAQLPGSAIKQNRLHDVVF